MKILLIRHSQAVDEASGIGDAGRWLTAKGRKVTRKVARWLAKNDKRRPLVIWTSPHARAMQTAEIIAAGVGHDGEVRVCAELSPGRDPSDLVQRVLAEPSAGVLALVGHRDSLSLLATALLGDGSYGELKKSAVLGVEWDGGAGRPWFLLDPAKMKAEKRAATPTDYAPVEQASALSPEVTRR